MIVLAVLAGQAFIVLGLLSLPVAFRGRVQIGAAPSGRMELAWAGGLVGARIAVAAHKRGMYFRLGTLPWFPLRGRSRKNSLDGNKPGKTGRRRSPCSGWPYWPTTNRPREPAPTYPCSSGHSG